MYLLPASQNRESLKIIWLQSGTYFAKYFLMKIDPLKSYNEIDLSYPQVKGIRTNPQQTATAVCKEVGIT